MAERFEVATDEAGTRADKLLADKLGGRSRSALAEAFDDGRVRINGKKVKKGHVVAAGDVIELEGGVAAPGGDAPLPDIDAPLEVVHLDTRLVVCNKPAGWPTHPLQSGEMGTLANAVVARYPECARASAAAREGGAAHRLDAGTSGLVVFARDREAWDWLRRAFGEGQVEKKYLALVVGEVSRGGQIDLPIAQSGPKAIVCGDPDVAARHKALPASTTFVPEKRYRGYTLLAVTATTGRMHQVRVHLAHLGTPVVGDDQYGMKTVDAPPVRGFFLHASHLTLPHPDGRGSCKLKAELPFDRLEALEMLTEL